MGILNGFWEGGGKGVGEWRGLNLGKGERGEGGGV